MSLSLSFSFSCIEVFLEGDERTREGNGDAASGTASDSAAAAAAAADDDDDDDDDDAYE